jgi:membrane-associated phospholipid phosphatase
VFILTLVMLAHYVLAVLFPVSGPVALRHEVMQPGWAFIPLMERLYGAFDRGGLAFPSTHAAAALIAGVYAARFFPRRRLALSVWVLVILVSTVLCAYHYTVDTLAGLATGAAGLAAGRWLWQRRGS